MLHVWRAVAGQGQGAHKQGLSAAAVRMGMSSEGVLQVITRMWNDCVDESRTQRPADARRAEQHRTAKAPPGHAAPHRNSSEDCVSSTCIRSGHDAAVLARRERPKEQMLDNEFRLKEHSEAEAAPQRQSAKAFLRYAISHLSSSQDSVPGITYIWSLRDDAATAIHERSKEELLAELFSKEMFGSPEFLSGRRTNLHTGTCGPEEPALL